MSSHSPRPVYLSLTITSVRPSTCQNVPGSTTSKYPVRAQSFSARCLRSGGSGNTMGAIVAAKSASGKEFDKMSVLRRWRSHELHLQLVPARGTTKGDRNNFLRV